MKELELKHLAGYLPYDLQLMFEKSGRIITMLSCCYDGIDVEIVVANEGNKYSLRYYNFKPLLRPLSDLVKEIEVNGERFVPLEKMCQDLLMGIFGYMDSWKLLDIGSEYDCYGLKASVYGRDQIGFSLNFDDGYKTFQLSLDSGDMKIDQLELFAKLHEYKFDLYGLIDAGLAIDLNTIK